ncbi:MAG: hypothetical protein DWH83_05310 [Planctomycetota bacterium]|nr:MAG: hypothetical protein DWH83_05310 [Planctomycetota bacterium]
MQPAWAAEPQGGDRVALLPPIDFNMEQDTFANEPVSDADPDVTKPRPRSGSPFGSSAPVSIGGFWAPAVGIDGQPATLGINAEYV